jgi:chemotaxis protein CheD
VSAVEVESSRATVYLHPGQLFVTGEACEIISVLGSCVSVCMYDRVRRIGGANHYLLPTESPMPSARYGGYAISALISRLLAAGAHPSELVAIIFGGACLSGAKIGHDSLGQRNVELARAALGAAKIPILSEDSGGLRGRRIVFRPDDGAVLVKRL